MKNVRACPGGNPVDVLISLFQFISRPHPATLTLESIPSFMVQHLQSILPSSHPRDGPPHAGHMFAGIHRSWSWSSCVLPCSGRQRASPPGGGLQLCSPSSVLHPAGVMTGRSAAGIPTELCANSRATDGRTKQMQTAASAVRSVAQLPCCGPPSWNFRRTYRRPGLISRHQRL